MEFMELVKEWLPQLQTPIMLVLAYFVWKIKTNDLPHIHDALDKGFREVGERTSKLEGRMDAHFSGCPHEHHGDRR